MTKNDVVRWSLTFAITAFLAMLIAVVGFSLDIPTWAVAFLAVGPSWMAATLFVEKLRQKNWLRQ